MATEHALGELWYEDKSTGLSTSFTAASSFISSATKLRHFEFDASSLTHEEIADTTVQTMGDGKPAPHAGRKEGSFSFKMWLEGGSSSTTAGTLATLMGLGLGGLKNPTAIDDSAETSSTSSHIYASSHAVDENDIVLVGTAGDGRAECKAAVVEDATSYADSYELQMALPVAPNNGDTIKHGHQVWIDWSDKRYFDFLYIGAHAGTSASDDPDSYQMIGCSLAGVGFGGFSEGAPWVQLTYNVAQWDWVNYANQATFSHSTSANGGDPVGGEEAGSMLLQDAGTTTRRTLTGDVEIEWPFGLAKVVDHNYVNDCGGWKKVPNDPSTGPTIRVTPYFEDLADMPGAFNDWNSQTAKQVLYQIGSTSQGSAVFYMQRAFSKPIDPSKLTDSEGLTGITLELVGDSGRATDLATDAKKQEDAAMILSFN